MKNYTLANIYFIFQCIYTVSIKNKFLMHVAFVGIMDHTDEPLIKTLLSAEIRWFYAHTQIFLFEQRSTKNY